MTAEEILRDEVETAEARLKAAQDRSEKNPLYQADVLAFELVVLELRRLLDRVIAQGA